jgi:hypothetical protein
MSEAQRHWIEQGYGIAMSPADDVLTWAWGLMEKHDMVRPVFYDGVIRTVDQFVEFAREPYNRFFGLTYMGELEAFAWVNCYEGRSARIHFSSIMHSACREHTLRKLEHGRHFVRYILTDNPGLWTVNRPALGYIKRIGFQFLGTVPEAYECPWEKEPRDIVMSYLNRRMLS